MINSLVEQIRFRGGMKSQFDWVVYQISGDDRENFLHGQTTSDVKNLSVGDTQMSCRVDTGGRIQSFFYLQKRPDDFLMLVPRELSVMAVENLEKYVIMEDVSFTLLAQNPFLILGPLSVLAEKKLPASAMMSLDFFEGPALVAWGEEEKKIIQELYSPIEIDDDIYESLRILGGFPQWGLDIHQTTILNESYLSEIGLSSTKGCYIGQETINKIRNNRGAAYFPVLLQLENRGQLETLEFFKHFEGRSFQVEGRKGGEVKKVILWENEIIFSATSFRQFRIQGQKLQVTFAGQSKDSSEDHEQEMTFSVKVLSLPFFKGHSRSSKALEIYDHALHLFTHQEDQSEETIKLLETAILLDPTLADAYEALGVIYGRLERFNDAIAMMKHLVEVDPQSIMAHTNLSVYYMKLGRIDEAEQEKAVATTMSFGQYAQESKRKKEDQEKLAQEREEDERRMGMFGQVLDIDPEDTLANYGIGDIYLKRGEAELALTYFAKVLQVDPRYASAYLAQGKALEVLQDKKAAEEVYLKGVKIAADKGELKVAQEMQGRLERLMKES